jgi:oxygen-independent coproporphyrinogen III oxidase
LRESALYIHIPFCDHKCIYCDFYSIITTDNVSAYLNSLLNEINYYKKLYSQDRIYTSIYFGGGTPSLMEPKYISQILNTIRNNFKVSEDAEITLETNPGTVNKNKLSEFLDAGINRLSVGVQSFDEEELKFLTRIHDKNTAVQTIKDASNAGFKNINLDLIFNLPKQTKEKWIHNLDIAAGLPINHLSAYSLIIENGTVLNKMILDGKVRIQEEDYDAELYEITMDFLEEQGFIQYEVSNFAKKGFECRHNNAYWHYLDYLGLGTSAHSFINNKRWWNYSNIRLYIDKIKENGNAVSSSELINSEQKFIEYVMLSLRSDGINLSEFQNSFGGKWLEDKTEKLIELKDKQFITFDDNYIKLTKRGYALCDEILTEIL